MTFKILSLDGGGIRGVLSARILQKIEEEIKNIENKETKENYKGLHDYFDLIAGTSTGSILAAGIACKKTAEELIKIYKEEGKNIFPKCVRWQRKWRWISRFWGSSMLYPHECGEQGLAQVLKRNLVDQESGKCPTIGEINKPNLLILAYDVFSRNTTWFSNDYDASASDKPWYNNIELWKICTASASAPTFFPPYELSYYDSDQEKLPHIDGGVSANNPELAAIAHALLIGKKDKDKKISMDDIAVLSIGTGRTTRPFKYDQIKNWGLRGWVTNIPHIFLDPSAEISAAISKQILKTINGQNYLRLDFDLNKRLEGKRNTNTYELRKLVPPYNEYIEKKIKEGKEDIDNPKKRSKELKEDIDNPEICDDLIMAADCYLEYGEVSNKPVGVAIQKFLKEAQMPTH